VPLFHAAALYLSLFFVHYWDLPIALGIGDRPLCADMAIECLKYADVDAIVLAPAIVEALSQSQESTDALKKLAYVVLGGGENPGMSHCQQFLTSLLAGTLSGEAGDRLVKNGVRLFNVISSTE
jgi:hypothetical protein